MKGEWCNPGEHNWNEGKCIICDMPGSLISDRPPAAQPEARPWLHRCSHGILGECKVCAQMNAGGENWNHPPSASDEIAQPAAEPSGAQKFIGMVPKSGMDTISYSGEGSISVEQVPSGAQPNHLTAAVNKKIADLESALAQLREERVRELRPYLGHKRDCTFKKPGVRICNCGLFTLLGEDAEGNEKETRP